MCKGISTLRQKNQRVCCAPSIYHSFLFLIRYVVGTNEKLDFCNVVFVSIFESIIPEIDIPLNWNKEIAFIYARSGKRETFESNQYIFHVFFLDSQMFMSSRQWYRILLCKNIRKFVFQLMKMGFGQVLGQKVLKMALNI